METLTRRFIPSSAVQTSSPLLRAMENTQDDARVGEALALWARRWWRCEALLEVLALLPAALLVVADVAALHAVSRRVRAHVHDRWRDAAVARHVLDALVAFYKRNEVSSRELAPLRMVCRVWSNRIASSWRYQAGLFLYSAP
jgi:hypothetical protein